MITLKDYAQNRCISYEAVRLTVKRYQSELEGHIIKKGRTRFLDDQAVNFLDDHRKDNAPRIQPVNDLDQLEYIQNLKDQIIFLQNQVIELKDQHQQAIETRLRLEMITDTNKKLEEEKTALSRELSLYERTIFGFYRKKRA